MAKTRTASRNGSQGLLFDPRFLETYAGERILKSPRTAIVELVANAWDAGATRVRIRWPDADLGGEFSIEDNGEGIAPENIKKIFQAFESGKGSRGTGLGLPVSRKILQEHGGDILVESTPGEGSRFTLELPAQPAQATGESPTRGDTLRG